VRPRGVEPLAFRFVV